MKYITTAFYTLLSLGLSTTNLYAESGKVYGLEELMQVTDKHNRNIKIAEKAVEAAEGNITVAVGNFMPELKVTAGQTQVIRQSPTEDGTTNFYSMQPKKSVIYRAEMGGKIFAGGRLWKTLEKEKVLTERAKSDIEVTREQTHKNLVSKYYNLGFAQAALEIEKKKLVFFKKHLVEMEAKAKAGAIRKNTLLGVKTDFWSAENDVAKAELDFDNAKRELAFLSGNDIGNNFSVLPLKEEFKGKDTAQFSNTSAGVSRSPDVITSGHDLKAADIDVQMAKSYYYPELSYFAAYQKDRDITNARFRETGSIGLEIKVPFANSFFNASGKTRAAMAQKLQSEIQHENTTREITLNLGTKKNDLMAASHDIDSTNKMMQYLEEVIKSDKAFLKAGEMTYQEYKKDYVEYLNAQKNWYNAISRGNTLYKNLQIDYGMQ